MHCKHWYLPACGWDIILVVNIRQVKYWPQRDPYNYFPFIYKIVKNKHSVRLVFTLIYIHIYMVGKIASKNNNTISNFNKMFIRLTAYLKKILLATINNNSSYKYKTKRFLLLYLNEILWYKPSASINYLCTY